MPARKPRKSRASKVIEPKVDVRVTVPADRLDDIWTDLLIECIAIPIPAPTGRGHAVSAATLPSSTAHRLQVIVEGKGGKVTISRHRPALGGVAGRF